MCEINFSTFSIELNLPLFRSLNNCFKSIFFPLIVGDRLFKASLIDSLSNKLLEKLFKLLLALSSKWLFTYVLNKFTFSENGRLEILLLKLLAKVFAISSFFLSINAGAKFFIPFTKL